ncbi:MAG: MogA/MoaB family molybdenum cofactor biosynthesis protein [Trueperella sp.]|nr:MogA/MoaB family molybdenum cofactor biosynthesis protein [Trueperella sp.]
MDKKLRASVITISDAAAAGRAEDLAGPVAVELLEDGGVEVVATKIVPDDVRDISEAVQNMSYDDIDLVFTIGGTGIGPSDYTARAMDPLLRFDIPGIADAIRISDLNSGVSHAMFSRGRAGVMVNGKERTLVVNAAGPVRAVQNALSVLLPILPYAIREIRGERTQN